ncbi:hypothetical protein OIU78_005429 [Salix suchowensis]|nr:hypothetical protein OIU78_005429 [Salix suchowensis]
MMVMTMIMTTTSNNPTSPNLKSMAKMTRVMRGMRMAMMMRMRMRMIEVGMWADLSCE